MKPVRTEEMKLGSMNEENVLKQVDNFLTLHSDLKIVHNIKEYGLLAHWEVEYAAFSPDGVCIIKDTDNATFSAVVEVKTRVSTKTRDDECKLQQKYGNFCEIRPFEDADRFKTVVPELAHRTQVLHALFCGSVQHSLLVYAKLDSIIRIIHITVTEMDQLVWINMIRHIGTKYLDWIYSNHNIPAAFLDKTVLGHAKDKVTLLTNLQLWRAHRAIVRQDSKPLPPAKRILPSVIDFWNRLKGGVDIYSRYLKNCKAQHKKQNPNTVIILRLLTTCVYNAYQSYILINILPHLENNTIQSYKQYQQYRNRLGGSFNNFCRDIALDNDLGVEITETHHIDTSEQPQTDQELKRLSLYKKRELYMSRTDLIALRLNKTHKASFISNGRQLTCTVCCSKNRHHVSNLTHSREGIKTR
jgi:hypothetical protein